MCREPSIGIARSLGIARAFWELANDGVNQGCLPRQQATTMSKAALDGARMVQGVLDDFGDRLSADATRAAKDSIIDLETLGELAGLVTSHQLTPKNAHHLARAMRHTAAQAVRCLIRTENALGAEGDWTLAPATVS